jgi:hypothetical protein
MQKRDEPRDSAFASVTLIVTLACASVVAAPMFGCASAGQIRDVDRVRQLTVQIDQLEAAERYHEAIPLAETVLTIYETQLPADHPDTISPRGRLAALYLSAANELSDDVVTKVEALLRRNVAIAERTRTPEDRRGLLTGRALLSPNQNLPDDYGLRSFLLFDAPPRDGIERARHLKALEAYLVVLPPMNEFERHRRRSQLNITLLPVTKNVQVPSEFADSGQVTRLAEQLLDSYDYARAKIIMDGLGKNVRSSGPFLVSVRPQGATQRLFVDMSHVVPDLVWDWTRTFCWLVAQERSWSEAALTKLELNSRNAFALAAKKYGDVLVSIGLLPAAGR